MFPDIKIYDKAAVIDTVVLAQELTKRPMKQEFKIRPTHSHLIYV